MTRELAVEAAKAIEDIDGFEAFMDEVDAAFGRALDWCRMPPEFTIALDKLMKDELQRRKDHLESL